MRVEGSVTPQPFTNFVMREARTNGLRVLPHQEGFYPKNSLYIPDCGNNSTGLFLYIAKKINEGTFGEKDKIAEVEAIESLEAPEQTFSNGLNFVVKGNRERVLKLVTEIHEVVSHETSLEEGATLEDVFGLYRQDNRWLAIAKRNVDELAQQYADDHHFFDKLNQRRMQYQQDEFDLKNYAYRGLISRRWGRMVA
jgi:hypothetical protein